jgi:hypothetical protein
MIYFDGRIPTHENRHDHLHRRSDAPHQSALRQRTGPDPSPLSAESPFGGVLDAQPASLIELTVQLTRS